MTLARSGILLALLLGAAVMWPARADPWRHHGHGSVGIYVGPPLGWPGYYPPPYYYPPVIAVPAEPPTYIERGDNDVVVPPLPAGYWYYCGNPAGYYPQVKQCAGGWQQVPPRPPAP